MIATVIVAFRRDNLLRRALDSVLNQSYKSNRVIIVDNANLESTKKIADEYLCDYLSGDISFGSAGGFSLGMKYALSLGARKVWLLDDDGIPSTDCLQTLVKVSMENKLEIASPISISLEDPNVTANNFFFGIRKIDDVSWIKKKEIRLGKVQFYNGVLLDRSVIEIVGLPKLELFMRGDELDYYYRCKRIFRMALVTSANFFHPSSKNEYKVNRTYLFSVNRPLDYKKRYYQYRNRGYLIREHTLILEFFFDLLRYPITFLIFRKLDLKGLREWFQLWTMGLRRDLTPLGEIQTS
jgi:rhamnopyranosyl-N-acetylglucosaminyl-diphospho-decaprenol beta-1,3/1,4-galactofuranosyltransferase